MDSHFLCLWSLSRLRHQHDRPYTLFADWLISSHFYCFRYRDTQSSSVHVDHSDGREPALVANSVREFLDLYLSDPEKLLNLRVQAVVICALPQEAKYLRKLSPIKRGQARLVVCGVGPANAERTIRKLLSYSKPTLVLSTGVAGALSPILQLGDVIVPNEVVDESTGRQFPCIQHSAFSDRHSALLSVSRMITSAEEKKSLFQKFGAVAVDMESAAIARVCAEQGIPFAVVRAVSDTAAEVLPEAVTRFFDPDGGLRVGSVLAEIVKNPSLLKTLRRLQSQTAIAGKSLRRFIEASPTDEL